MQEINPKVDFTFGWLAMKLLGKSLYSNPWSAISELVANGFDANADKVYVYINLGNKENSTIEIFDNGTGMTNEEIQTYVKVGYNKRTNPDVKARMPMGRKGIGKLAALYLSDNYSIITKTKDGKKSAWQMHYTETEGKIDEKPFLKEIGSDLSVTCSNIWNGFKTGTYLKLTGVNLVGNGNVAFEALEQKLSNYFSLETINKKIMICAHNGGKIKFHQVKKSIAFGNMAYIEYSGFGKMSLENEFNSISKKTIKVPYAKPVNNQTAYEFAIDLKELNRTDIHGTYSYTPDIEVKTAISKAESKEKRKQYTLKGWIGIHSSINKKVAEVNDSNFQKNKFYNPNQLRLYVRNKLAIENFLNVINNTQAFVNYIEGEISFDLLDEDDLPDIATSNRQSMDENDNRITLLKGIVETIIQNLISKRNKLAKAVESRQTELSNKYNETAKQQFTEELEEEVKNFDLTEEAKADFIRTISNKVSGDMIKNDYVVFLSHARKNRIFTDFLYNLLLNRGADASEFFYTSSDSKPEDYDDLSDLGQRIKKSIVSSNTLLFYLTSADYKMNEYCMFEGGAGWATRAVGDYLLWTLDYKDIPVFLTNKKLEIVINQDLDKDRYVNLVSTLNKIIGHLNSGRKLKEQNLIEPFRNTTFPDAVQLQKESKTIFDYMDPLILDYWKVYIQSRVS
ncbi:ATP-binding protein [Sulfuricurvum sp.]|uniref:ATP-binding protein n=1 Tax=Sulfuricurvum sp. TaxID=2025608 RepID=UPI002E3537A8|nr:ATP-binding protein [Sulfuricurvum sp.]HEX5330634.1 ATP-binding protein [Sulfuricurvum sp.]